MSDETSEPEAEPEPGSGFELLRDPEALRVLAHPTRQRIFTLAAQEPVSPKEVARTLEQPIPRVSYHVRAMVEAGLLRVVRKTKRRGVVETHYRAISTLELSDEVLESAGAEFRSVWGQSIVRLIADDAQHAFACGAAEEPDTFTARAHLVTTTAGRKRVRDEIEDFYRRLARLEEELVAEARGSIEPTHDVVIGLLFYPASMAGLRHRPIITARGAPGEPAPDTIPSMASDRF